MPHPAELDAWTARVTGALGLDDAVDVPAVLDLARDAAHSVARPAAPLTTYLVGIAVGRGIPLQEAMRTVLELLPRTDKDTE